MVGIIIFFPGLINLEESFSVLKVWQENTSAKLVPGRLEKI